MYINITFDVFDISFLLGGEEVEAREVFDGVDGDGIVEQVSRGGVVFHEKGDAFVGRVGDVDDDLEIICRYSNPVLPDKFIRAGHSRSGDDEDTVILDCPIPDLLFQPSPDPTIKSRFLGAHVTHQE